MKELKLKMAAIQKDVMDDMKAEMDRRGFASTKYKMNKITEAIASLGETIGRMGSVHPTPPSPLDQEIIQEWLATSVMMDEHDVVLV